MATADGSVNIDSKIDGSGFSSGLSKMSGAAKTALGAMTGLIGGAAAALGGAAVAGVKYNSQMEQYVTSFGTMLGGADKAQGMISDLKKYAAETPFEFTDLAKGTQTLLSFGVSASDIMPDLKMLGDISQGNTDKFNSLSLAFAQTSSSGKLMGQDLLQYVSAGFNPLNELSKMTGKSMSELRDEMSKGQISAQDVADAFKHATSQGGQFFGAMTDQSKTFSGQMSTLKDNAMQFLGDLTKGLQENLKNTALPMVNGWMDELSKAFSTSGVQGVVSAFGGVLSQAVTAIANQAPRMVSLAVSLIQSLVQGLTKNASQLAGAVIQIVGALANGISRLLPQLLDLAVQLVLALANGISEHADRIVSGASALIEKLNSALIQAAPKLAEAAVKLATAFFSALDKQHPVGTPLVTAVIGAIGAYKGISTAANTLDTFTKSITNLQKSGGLLKNFSLPFKTIGSDIASLGKTIGSGLLTGLKNVGGAFSSLFSVLAANHIILIIAGIVALVAAIIVLWNTNEGFRNAVIGAWNAIVGFFTTTIPTAFNSFVSWWNGLWTQVGQFFADCWNGIISFFTETIPAWIASVGEWFQKLPYNLGIALGTAVKAVLDFGTNVWNWVTTDLPKIIQGIGDWFAKLPGNIWNFLVQIVTNIGKWSSNMVSVAQVEIPKFINSVGAFFSQLPGKISEFLVSVVNNVVKWAGNLVSTAKTEIPKFVLSVVSFISELPGKMLDIGKNIVQGIWNGIKNSASWLWGKITGFCNDFVAGFKKGLGIHSPSKLFADEVGKFVPPGITVGMDKAMPAAVRDMQSQLSNMLGKAKSTVAAEQARFSSAFSPNYQLALAGGYGTDAAPAEAYTGPSTVEAHINIDSREFAVATAPAIAKQIGWKGST